jgi:hypothetical protein
MVSDSRMLAGTAHPHDAARARELIERDFDRVRNFASATNHFMLDGGDEWHGRVGELREPLLVIHGTPIFPIEHGAHRASVERLLLCRGGA